jgi:hypothetical protein
MEAALPLSHVARTIVKPPGDLRTFAHWESRISSYVLSLYRYWHSMRLFASARNMSILYGSVLLCSNLRFVYSISLYV